MPQMMQFTKHGHTVDLDIPLWDEANATAREYAYFYGWRQTLQDSYASAKTAAEMDGAVRKKFEKIISGLVKFRFDGQASRKSELETEMDAIATSRVQAHAARKSIKLTKVKLEGYVAEYLARTAIFEEIRIEAEENLSKRREMAEVAIAGDDFFADMS